MVIKTLTKSLFYSAFLWFSVAEVSAQKTQKIGDNPYSIDSKAVLELESTTKGFLPPRMTTAQMNAITSPTEGMIVYCTDCGVNTDGELRIAYNSVWQTFKGDLTGNVTGTSANVTGVVAAANGGTGAATLTGYVKGNGTSTMTASATIPVADVSGAAPLASPTFTGTVTGVTSTMVGLGNVNNTSDASKPVSTATQTALDLKAPLASPTFTGTPSLPTGTTGVTQSASDNSTKLATTAYADAQATAAVSGKQSTLTNSAGLSGALSDETGTGLAVFATSPTLVTPNLGTPSTLVGTNITGTASGLTAGAVTTNANLTGEVTSTGNATTVTNSAVIGKVLTGYTAGAGTVTATDNILQAIQKVDGNVATNASNISAATANVSAALDLKANIASPTFTGTVSGVTPTMVGLGNVNNTSDASKPVSTATQTALDLKAPLASPTFTGTPLAPTPTAGDNTTKVATTEFVVNAVSSATSGAFVDLTTAQTVAGAKTFSSDMTVNGITVGKGSGNQASNTATGTSALSSNTSGQKNTANGSYSLWSNTTGSNNTATGTSALETNTDGSYNTVNGSYSLYANTSGSDNTANGSYTLVSNSTGSNNTATGSGALRENTTGGNNTALGYGAGNLNTTGTNNTLIGYDSDVASNNLSNATAIGNGASVAASNTIQLGNTSVTNVNTSGTIKAGTVTYPNAHNTTAGQVLTTDASGVASWATPSSSTPSDATTSAKGIVKLAGDLAGTADVPTIASNAVTTAKILNANVTDAKLATGIDAAKLADGTVSNAELQYINSLTSNAQTQISTNATDITALETLADGKIYLGNGSNVATEVTMSGDVTMSNAGAATIGASKVVSSMIADGTIVDADISSSAAIAQSKVSNLTTDLAAKAPLASPTFTGTVTAPTLVAGTNTFPTNRGTANQVLTTDGSGTLAWSAPVVIEVFDEFSVGTTGNTAFTLTATPGASSIVKMYVNGVLISKTGYTLSGTALTYVPANNVNYALTAGDRVQFIYTR